MAMHDAVLVQTRSDAAAADTDVAFGMDEDAFRGFYDRTSRMLWVYLERLTGDRQAADDLLQESYYRLLSSTMTFEGESHRRHYLFRIATNLARDRFRRRRTRPAEISHDEVEACGTALAGPTPAPELGLDLASAFASLRARERALLWLAYAHGASHQEIARVVGVGTASVKPLLFRARRRLAVLLDRKGAAR